MKSLIQYINEAKFSAADFYKHNYVKDVISKLMTTGEIRLGANGEETFKVPVGIMPELRHNLNGLSKKPDLKAFNDIMTRFNLPVWSKIFKGDFSGYTAGLASKNRGNAFEDEFIANFSEYAPALEKALGLKQDAFYDCHPVSRGAENQRRPLVVDGRHIIIGGSHDTVGESVVDVFVEDNDGNPYNLSLKFGPAVTFCNTGVMKLFPEKSFKKFEETGEYKPETANGVSGEKLLGMFGIDKDKFAKTFVSYGREKFMDEEDVTDALKHNDDFDAFIGSVIGYNYVLVHKMGRHTRYIDLRTKKDMDNFIGHVKRATVHYGGRTGGGKRVDVTVEMTNMRLNIVLRSKTGGTYPTHIMADYVIHH